MNSSLSFFKDGFSVDGLRFYVKNPVEVNAEYESRNEFGEVLEVKESKVDFSKISKEDIPIMTCLGIFNIKYKMKHESGNVIVAESQLEEIKKQFPSLELKFPPIEE